MVGRSVTVPEVTASSGGATRTQGETPISVMLGQRFRIARAEVSLQSADIAAVFRAPKNEAAPATPPKPHPKRKPTRTDGSQATPTEAS